MLMNALRKLDRWLRDHQDPRYRNAPWILPRVWHGGGQGGLSADDLARLNFNVRDIGLDPNVVSQQPHHRMLARIAKRSHKETTP